MKLKSNKLILLFTMAIVLSAFTGGRAADDVDLTVYKTLQMDATPIDVAITPDGRKIYVLTEQGQVLVFSGSTEPDNKFDVGKHVDQIKLGPRGDSLILKSSKNKTVQVVTVDFIQQINTSGSPFKGSKDAPVVIAVFDDFEWPYCARLVPVLEQVLEKYPNDVKIVYKSFPLKNHKFAMKAAVAALAAESQGKFWEFHKLLFKNYNKLNDQKIQDIAVALGLNEEEYEKKKKDPAIANNIEQDLSEARRIGVRATPTVFINGIRLRNRSLKGFQAAIDKQLKKLAK